MKRFTISILVFSLLACATRQQYINQKRAEKAELQKAEAERVERVERMVRGLSKKA